MTEFGGDMGIRPVHGLMSRIGYISLEHKE